MCFVPLKITASSDNIPSFTFLLQTSHYSLPDVHNKRTYMPHLHGSENILHFCDFVNSSKASNGTVSLTVVPYQRANAKLACSFAVLALVVLTSGTVNGLPRHFTSLVYQKDEGNLPSSLTGEGK